MISKTFYFVVLIAIFVVLFLGCAGKDIEKTIFNSEYHYKTLSSKVEFQYSAFIDHMVNEEVIVTVHLNRKGILQLFITKGYWGLGMEKKLRLLRVVLGYYNNKYPSIQRLKIFDSFKFRDVGYFTGDTLVEMIKGVEFIHTAENVDSVYIELLNDKYLLGR